MLAAVEGHADVARLLLNAGADRNAKNKDDETAFDLAKAGGHDDLAALLRAPTGQKL